MARRPSRALNTVVLSVALGLTLAACGGSSSTTSSSSSSASGSSGSDSCAAYRQYGDLKGKTVSIYTGIVTPEDVPYQDSYKPFETCTGAKIAYEGDKTFETQVLVRAKAGNPPDIGIVPQPGLLKQLVATGKVKEAPAEVAANVDKFWSPEWKGYATVDGKFYGAPSGASIKSLVWYSPKEFKDKGYTVPKTLDELFALTDKIAKTGAKPWCAGIGSGEATGWPITDWMEDMMLRLSGPDEFDKWVNHTIAFNSAEPTAALDEVGKILKNPKYVNGGLGDVKTIATTTFQDGGQPILTGGCSLHRQASFYAANWPQGTKVAEDGDVFAFYLPGKSDVEQAAAGWRRVQRRVQRPSRGQGLPDLAVHRHLGQQQGRELPCRRLGQRQQGTGREQADEPDRQARRHAAPGPEVGLPLRRLGPDARCRGFELLLEAGHQLDHGSEHEGHGGQDRSVVAEVAGQLTAP